MEKVINKYSKNNVIQFLIVSFVLHCWTALVLCILSCHEALLTELGHPQTSQSMAVWCLRDWLMLGSQGHTVG